MGERANNFKSQILDNPQKRNIYFAIVGLGLITVIAGFVFVGKNNTNKGVAAGANVAGAPTVSQGVGVSNSPEYNKKVAEVNAQKASEALASGGGYISTPTNTGTFNQASPMDMLEKEQQAKAKEEEDKKAKEELDRLKKEQDNNDKIKQEEDKKAQENAQKAQVVAQQNQITQKVNMPVVQSKSAGKYNMNDDYILISTLTGMWKTKPTTVYEFDYKGKSNQDNSSSSGENNATTNANTENANADATTSKAQATATSNTGTAIAPAGTIYNAVLTTGINSDEPSPVLAQIVSGDLKGAKLIGQISTVGEKVVIQFSTLTAKGDKSSMKINAVAIDPASSRTALASDVDNHYFLKYGVLLASTFLGGYADAISQQNTTTTTDALGGTTVSRGKLDSKQINQQAIGAVGKEVANQTRSSLQNLKPTITVNQGTAIGILIMDDLYKK